MQEKSVKTSGSAVGFKGATPTAKLDLQKGRPKGQTGLPPGFTGKPTQRG